jgi:hypothetical protein
MLGADSRENRSWIPSLGESIRASGFSNSGIIWRTGIADTYGYTVSLGDSLYFDMTGESLLTPKATR